MFGACVCSQRAGQHGPEHLNAAGRAVGWVLSSQSCDVLPRPFPSARPGVHVAVWLCQVCACVSKYDSEYASKCVFLATLHTQIHSHSPHPTNPLLLPPTHPHPHHPQELGLIGLRIQRMPCAVGVEFNNPATYPYLSVASPSCHDVSPLRAW